MTREGAAADLEACFCTFAYEFDREVAVVNHGDEKVALFAYESDDFAYLWGTDPVQFLLDDGSLDAGDEELCLVQLSEVEEVYVEFDSCGASPCEDVCPELVKTRFFYVHHDVDCGYFAHLQQTSGHAADELADLSFPENMLLCCPCPYYGSDWQWHSGGPLP